MLMDIYCAGATARAPILPADRTGWHHEVPKLLQSQRGSFAWLSQSEFKLKIYWVKIWNDRPLFLYTLYGYSILDPQELGSSMVSGALSWQWIVLGWHWSGRSAVNCVIALEKKNESWSTPRKTSTVNPTEWTLSRMTWFSCHYSTGWDKPRDIVCLTLKTCRKKPLPFSRSAAFLWVKRRLIS